MQINMQITMLNQLNILIRKNISNSKKAFIRQFYDVRSKSDTIFALATPTSGSRGAPLGVIRVSGPQTRYAISRLTNLNNNLQPRKATLTKVFKIDDNSDIIDIGLVIFFSKPNSYTGEDVCEFHLHGSHAILRLVLSQLGQLNGFRPADPGEFTRRAVVNNKMSLIQAESLPDLISARTDKQRQLALRGLQGHVVTKYESWISDLIKILAHLEASIDFGEDELIGEVRVVNECISKLNRLSKELDQFIRASSRSTNYIRNGFKVAIVGKPNVGKSSLMNKLCQADKSIVSDLCGTTRDVIEQCFELNGHSLILCDTAGLRNLSDQQIMNNDQHIIELEGIRRAMIEASKADVIIHVFDVNDLVDKSNSLSDITEQVCSLVRDLKTLDSRISQDRKIIYLVFNKIDLKQTPSNDLLSLETKLKQELGEQYSIMTSQISCKTDQNLEELVKKLSQQLDSFLTTDSDYSSYEPYQNDLEFVNERHLSFLRSCQRNLEKASQLQLSTIDRMAQHVRDATDYLSRCIETVTNDQVLDIIFRDFCIGK